MGFLQGIRAVTFTTSVAGPNAARVLAACGAEVIKIESHHGGLDNFRYFGTTTDLDIAPRFIESNLNVLSALINLKDPTGIRLTKELIAKSDVVLDNFRPDVMNRLGLGPDELRAMKLRPEDLAKRGMHPVLGVVTLSNLLATWPAHDLTHLHQLSRVMAYQYKEAVGPWTKFLGVMHCNGHSEWCFTACRPCRLSSRTSRSPAG